MTEKKYEISADGRVVALRDFGNVKKGYVGGIVDSESNLSHEGNCWVSAGAWVHDDARVYGNAQVAGDVQVYDDARVYGNARVHGTVSIFGNAQVFGDAKVWGDAQIHGDARVFGDARVYGNAEVWGDAQVTRHCIVIQLHPSTMTQTDNHVCIGSEQHTLDYWLENFEKLRKVDRVPDENVRMYKNTLKLLDKFRGGK